MQKDIERQKALVAKGGLVDFVRMAWPLVEPARAYQHNWHIDVIAAHLEAVSRGEIRNLIINVPPGFMKSLLVCVFWPVWEWIQRPGIRWINASFDLGITTGQAKKIVDILQSKWFQDRWGDLLKSRDPAVGKLDTTETGWRISTSVRGKATGFHADITVVDDPIKPRDLTKKLLLLVLDWWDQTMASRQADPKTGRRVIIMQRLHETDLAGVAIATGDYVHVRLPMRYEAEYPCETPWGRDPRTEEGELLWPSRVPIEAVAKLEKELGPVGTAAQLQQRPSPAKGLIFEKGWFQEYDELPPDIDQWVQSWDMTFKAEDASDYVCGGVIARKGANYYLVHLLCERLSFPECIPAVKGFSTQYPQALEKLVEDKANGPAIVATLNREIPGLVLVNPQGGKVSRANACAPILKAGNFWIPRGARWGPALIAQMTGFPKGANDDMVDMVSQALNHMQANVSNLVAAMAALQARMDGKR